jgi:CRP-like cAMP-binding protein
VEKNRITALQRTLLFGCLTEKELADIAQRATELRLKQGEMLFFSGDDAKGLFVVVSGKIRVFAQTPEGREQVMHTDTAGCVLADVPVFDDGPYPASAVAELDAEVLFIEKNHMHQFCIRYPHLALTALRLMASRVRRHAQLVKALSFHDVGHRLASFLITEVQYVGKATEGRIAFQLVLSNQEIASRIGSVRDVVSRAFARLKQEGLIARKGRSVIIPDLRALRGYAASAGTSGMTKRADSCH